MIGEFWTLWRPLGKTSY